MPRRAQAPLPTLAVVVVGLTAVNVKAGPDGYRSGISGPVEVLAGDGSTVSTLNSACSSAACPPLAPYLPGDPPTVTLSGQGAPGDPRRTRTPQYLQSTAGAVSRQAGLSSH